MMTLFREKLEDARTPTEGEGVELKGEGGRGNCDNVRLLVNSELDHLYHRLALLYTS